MGKIIVDKKPFATKRCPYCGNKLSEPLGVGPSSKAVMRYTKGIGLDIAQSSIKRWVMLGLLPRPIKKRMRMGNGKVSSIGVYSEGVKGRLDMIAKMRLCGWGEKRVVKWFDDKGIRYV